MMESLTHVKRVRSVCCYCGTGCGVLVESDGARITGVAGDPEHPANAGRLCSKGATLHLTARRGGRALYPELRVSRGEARRRASWDAALEHLAERFASIIRAHGPDAVGFYISGQLLTEDYHAFNKLARALVQTNNVDSNSRLCMSSAVSGYKATLGADAPPACYEDIALADCVLIAGSNTAWAHPVLFRRLEDARRANPQQKLIVVDPRRTDTAADADLHLAILPGTDVALFNGLLHIALWEGLADRDFIARHTEGFDAVRDAVRECTPAVTARLCGVGEADLVTAARWFAGSKASLSLYCQGLNQSVQGTDKNIALINLHLASGQIGRPGAGPLSLTGQPNAMGGRETGGMATLLPGHRDPANAGHRTEIARLWGVPALPERPGKTATELFEAARRGEIKALWIACTNPAQSLPDQAGVREALERAELVVVQEASFATETAGYADVLLPAATWGEKEGTLTNSERRISRARAALPPPGEARPDWQIAADFARRLAQRLHPEREGLFAWQGPEELFAEHREATRGRDPDITGLDYALLEARGPQQWPFPEGAAEGRSRLYQDGRFPTESGRARFVAVTPRGTAEDADARHPLRLTTGRLRDQWHGMARTGNTGRLFSHSPGPALSLNPDDARRLRLGEGELAKVTSRRGSLVLPVELDPRQRPGQAFVPMHWGSRYLSGLGVNALALAACDPLSRQPELKHAAVRVERVELPWRLAALALGEPEALMARLQPFLSRFPFAACVPFGREREGVGLRAAADAAPDAALLAELDAALGLAGEGMLEYRDARRGVSKRVRLADGRLAAARLSGETLAYGWLRDAAAEGLAAAELRRWVLAPAASLPAAAPQGKVVCNCLNVTGEQIADCVAAGADLAALQGKLGCGTQCGSCLPEIRRLLREAPVAA
jgi:assimilatory nitrate reductase catalytic subunit